MLRRDAAGACPAAALHALRLLRIEIAVASRHRSEPRPATMLTNMVDNEELGRSTYRSHKSRPAVVGRECR